MGASPSPHRKLQLNCDQQEQLEGRQSMGVGVGWGSDGSPYPPPLQGSKAHGGLGLRLSLRSLGVSGQVERNKERKGEIGSTREPWLRRAGEPCSLSNKDH